MRTPFSYTTELIFIFPKIKFTDGNFVSLIIIYDIKLECHGRYALYALLSDLLITL